MKNGNDDDISIQNFKRHQDGRAALGPETSPDGLDFCISVIAVLIAGISIFAGMIIYEDNGLAVGVSAIAFTLRQISRHILFWALVLSIAYHSILFISGLDQNSRMYDDGFLALKSTFNLAIMLPWATNLYLILYKETGFSRSLEIAGSLGCAFLSAILAFLNFSTVAYYYDMPIVHPEEFEIPLVIGFLSILEALLFLWLMAKGR